MSILDLLQLNDTQARAASAPGDVVVTAGAGSGKTRTLVARYLSLLESGVPLRDIVAITFTVKAAREMRTRVRRAIVDWLAQGPPRRSINPLETDVRARDVCIRAFWEQAFAELDAARVGTIHGLCAQIIRAHPVAAARLGYLPGFGVLEEGRAAVLRARAVEEALAWAAEDDAASRLFGAMGELNLRTVVATLLDRRLDADAAFERLADDPLETWAAVMRGWLAAHLDVPRWQGSLSILAGLRADAPADKMELARQDVLACAQAVDAARRQGDLDAVLAELAALRAAATLNGRKANWTGDALATAKEAMRDLRDHFDRHLRPLADPKKPAAWELDEEVAGLIWPLHATYRRALESYAQSRRAENALDFDDLEAGALALLEDPQVRAFWQDQTRAVLVDEFQDTNERQRQIVYALTGFTPDAKQPTALRRTYVGRTNGRTINVRNVRPYYERGFARNMSSPSPASLFVVGDAKQSIYRFRGADVTVFRRVQDDVEHAGGHVIALDLTFRAHRSLVETTNCLLAPVLDQVVRPDRAYAIPFVPLTAYRADPRPGVAPPFVEFLLGLGQSAGQGREAAAAGLATRLIELHAQERIEWQDVALLFRASTHFSLYEDALERAGIPFVTVAGRGFYDRYEVRDLLNALVAVADPTDDLALVGFLRSPGVGLTDATLYRLRFPPASVVPRGSGNPCSIWSVLNHPALPEIVPQDDLSRAVRGRELIAGLHDLAGRVPVAGLLKRLLDRTAYRAALGASEGGTRALRNVDKLLADAHTSGLVSVGEFLEYVRTLRDVGARESEAPTEAGSAVQLMTVHKAKGLEFPVLVIADAAHAGHGGGARVRLDAQLGVTVDLRVSRDDDRRPAAFQLAALRDVERDDAEDRRLLYVAATRAREKLLVSAHTKIRKGGQLSLSGWLKLLGERAGLDDLSIPGTPIEPQPLPLAQDIGCTLYPWREEQPSTHGTPADLRTEGCQQPVSRDLVAPLATPTGAGTETAPSEWRVPTVEPAPKLTAREGPLPRRVWRVVPRTERPYPPAWVVGTLVHAALRHWRFEEQGMEAFLRPFALEMGVVDEGEIHEANLQAQRLLRRFRAHPLWAEMDAAQRWHEVPFSIEDGGQLKRGVIDLLYRVGGMWKIAEFKTDRPRPGVDLPTHIRNEEYDKQVARYKRAVRLLCGEDVEATIVFLNVSGGVAVVSIPVHGSVAA